MRLAGLVTAGLAFASMASGSNQGNSRNDEYYKSPSTDLAPPNAGLGLNQGSIVGQGDYHKGLYASGNDGAKYHTRELSGNEGLYLKCRADVSSDMDGFYDNLYVPLNSVKKAEFDTILTNSGVTLSEDKLNLILEFAIDNPLDVLGFSDSESAVDYLQSGDLAGYSCIDTRPNARYYEQCRVNRFSGNALAKAEVYYDNLYAGMGDTQLRSEYDVQITNSGLTDIFDKTDFILEYFIDISEFVFRDPITPTQMVDYLQTTDDLVHNCIDPNTSSLPTSNPTSQPTIDVSQYTDICKADRTQSEADTQAEQYELYRRIHPDYQSGVYTVLTNATNLTVYEKLDSVFEYCIENPGSLYCETSESAYNWLRTDFKLYPYKSCANLGLAESPTPAPSAAPSLASTTGQLTDSPTSVPSLHPVSSPSSTPSVFSSLNPTIQITEIDCSELSYSEKKDCLLMNSLFETSEKAKSSYNIDFELQDGSFQSMYDGLSVDPNLMIHTYREFESLVPSFTYASGASVFKSMSLGCQVSALTMLDSDVISTYSSLDQFMTLCSASVISEVQKKDEDAYALMQRLSLDVDVMMENTDTINDEISRAYTGESSSLQPGRSNSIDGGLVRGADGKFHFGLFSTPNQAPVIASVNQIDVFNESVIIQSKMKQSVDFTSEADESYQQETLQNYVLGSLAVVCLINLGLSIYALLNKNNSNDIEESFRKSTGQSLVPVNDDLENTI